MSDILYFTNNPESPCAKAFRNREGILTFGITDEFTQYRDAAKAAIVDADGEDRQFMIKALLKEKLPFALCDLAGETPESLKRLCAAAKRRHIQVGWLGSWRFEWAMARLKEILCSGVLGTVQQLKLVKPEADGIFERLKDDDLINWLNSGIECALAYEDSQEEALTPTGWEEEAAALGKRQIPGSVAFVPGAAGLILAGEVVKDIAGI